MLVQSMADFIKKMITILILLPVYAAHHQPEMTQKSCRSSAGRQGSYGNILNYIRMIFKKMMA